MKAKVLIFLSLLLAGSACAQDWYERWDAAGSTWYEKWDHTINSIDSLEPGERIYTLSKVLGVGGNRKMNGQEKSIFDRAQKALLAIPGHARYYKDKLDKARDELLGKRISYDAYDKTQEELGVLRYLPSAETVAVLGDLVEDPVGRDGKTLGGANVSYGDGRCLINALIGAGSLGSLGIEGGPITSPLEEDEWVAVDKWKEWWKEVKDGKRTYSFKGSPVVYGADGPVTGAQLQKIEQEREREEAKSIAHGKKGTTAISNAPEETSKVLPVAMIMAALAVISSLVWYFARAGNQYGKR